MQPILLSTLQNPQFNKSATYVIFAHLLRQVSSLADGEHHFLVHWFRRLLNLFTCFRTVITPFKSCAFLVCIVTVLYANPCYIHVHCACCSLYFFLFLLDFLMVLVATLLSERGDFITGTLLRQRKLFF